MDSFKNKKVNDSLWGSNPLLHYSQSLSALRPVQRCPWFSPIISKMNYGILVVVLLASCVEGRQWRSLIKSCPEGYELVENPVSGKAECTCLPYHLYWPGDGLCYREMTRGPCLDGHKLVWNSETEKAECTCPPFWTKLEGSDGDCYEEYTQGLSNFSVILNRF